MKKHCLTAVLCAAMLLTSCGNNTELTKHTKPLEIAALDGTEDFVNAQMQFSLALFTKAAEQTDENLLISPYLAASAWLTAAEGEPAEDSAEPFGGILRSELNSYFVKWRSTQTELHTAQSIWIAPDQKKTFSNDDLRYYLGLSGTQVFADALTPDAVNQWLRDATDGALTEISVPDNADAAILSAAAIDLAWSDPYSDNEVQNVLFISADGKKTSVPFLSRTYDNAFYLEDDSIRGLRKNCAGQKYALLVLMPKSGTVTELLEAMTPEQLKGYIRSGTEQVLRTGIPQMKETQTTDLSALLPETGIGQIIQQVSVGIGRGSEESSYKLNLNSDSAKPAEQMLFDHPFVYFVIDRQYGLPVFAGTVGYLS